ncbi:MAG: hypothetical protein DWI48_06770 [Chloroflexi bacterium]|nr:MAG: hypothetical protein DWI48_06770 [Chloroflexota bacterium]
MTSASPAPLSAAELQAQLGAPYTEVTTAEERERHAELLATISVQRPLALHLQPRRHGRWRVTVAAADTLGALSIISGSLTAARLDIESADLFTLRVPALARASRVSSRHQLQSTAVTVGRLLDIFEVRPDARWDDARWDQLLADTSALLAAPRDEARARVVDAVSDVLRATPDEAGARLWPVTVNISLEADETRLHLTGQDTPGFLFELTNALALLNVNITRGHIRTIDGETDDVLVIRGAHGESLEDEASLRQVRAAVALIKQFTALLPDTADPAQALRQFAALMRQLLTQPQWADDIAALEDSEAQRTLAEVMGASTFLWEDFLRMQHASLFPLVGDMATLDRRVPRDELERDLAQRLATSSDAPATALNAFKDHEMFRIDLRHITGRIDFRTFAAELTELAEVVVATAAWLAADAVALQSGTPRLTHDEACPWAVFALGKFGGSELGFASDIELLFAYAGDGMTDGAQPQPNDRYFEAWVREFLATIATRESGIFEVDMRLRPHGNAGPLASSVAGLAAYYATDGEALPFERLALVKLRQVAGDPALGARVEVVRDAFVYSAAPLDRDEIAHLRERQANELVPTGEVSAKHSTGGVVDIEYWVQARQIEVGAHDPSVRTSNTLLALERLAGGGHIEATLATDLAEAYSFLRRLIDALRVVRGNAHDLTIPARDSRAYAYLARRLELDPAALDAALEQHMSRASSLWTP